MARSAVLLAACLVACLAAGALAELCPQRSSYNGCLKNGCVALNSGRRTATLVCNECGAGYELVNRGERTAKCQCAPGYGGKGNQGLCKPCAAGTQIALGGPIPRAACLNCPSGTLLSEDGKTCVCPAGTYHAVAAARDGFMGLSCKACTARNAYRSEDAHEFSACATCLPGLVANKDHTMCVEPSDPDAAPAPELPALFGGGGSDSAGTASAGNANNPFEGLGNAIKNARMSAQQRAAADEQKRVAALEESDGANPLQKAIGDGLTALTSGDPADFNLPAMLQKLGQGLSQAAPKLNPLALLNANKLDPRAMEEAGLPAASSVPQLMSSFLKDAMGSIDTSAWSN